MGSIAIKTTLKDAKYLPDTELPSGKGHSLEKLEGSGFKFLSKATHGNCGDEHQKYPWGGLKKLLKRGIAKVEYIIRKDK